MKRIFTASIAMLAIMPALAVDTDQPAPEPADIVSIDANARADYQHQWNDGSTVKSNSGFEGKNLNLMVKGSIVPGLNYAWRQRFNKSTFDGNFFDATDYIQLDWNVKDWTFSAGKLIDAVGGFEYDTAPIDVFGLSVFTYNFPCYDFGASVAYRFNPHSQLTAQVTQSPFFTRDNRDMYSYNLMYSGSFGCYTALHSVNMVEYADGKFINYIALGNKFDFDQFTLKLDLMNRAASHQTFFFKDCSVIAELSYRPTSRWNIFAKYSYDVNRTHTDADLALRSGTELSMVGAGVQFHPLQKKKMDLRLHANVFYSWGTNTNTSDLMQNKTLMIDCGVTWYMHLYSLKHKN